MQKSTELKLGLKNLDILKFVMALIVVYAHSEITLGNFGSVNLAGVITSLVVPIFFIITSYFIFRNGYDQSRLKISIKKFAKLYCIWSLIYFPFAIMLYYVNSYTIKESVLDYLKGFFILGEHYYSWPLWYLMAGIYAMLIVYGLKKLKINDWLIFALSLIVYSINGILNIFSVQIPALFKYTILNGRVITAFFYISVGLIIKYLINSNFVLKYKNVICILFVFLLVVRVFWQNFITIMLISVGLFLVSIISSNLPIKNPIFFRKSSTIIYFTHMIFYFIWNKILQFEDKAILGFVFVVICTVGFSFVYQLLLKKDIKFINKLDKILF